jgi:putative enoyl-(acyl-carrier-protein) reductase II
LGIEYPIFQGGMAWVATGELAAAVSNAGGLGIIGAGNSSADILRANILKAKKLTGNPFGVNVMLMSPFVDEVMELLYEEHVSVITTGAGNPGKYIDKLKEIGTKVIPVVPSVALAKRMEKEGVDAVIAEGTESGGHIGDLTTMALVPQVVDAVGIPVIAAGGIADGRGLVAALSLGAAGVQIGTRFICSKECTVHENYKMAIVNARDRDAVATGRSTGHPVRCLKNKLTREFDRLESMNAPMEDIEKFGAGRLKAAVVDGDMEYGSVMAGQISGMVKEIRTCDEIIKEIIADSKSVLERIEKLY